MTSPIEITVVVAIVAVALLYLARKGYDRITSRSASCGGCAGACGGEAAGEESDAEHVHVLTEINLLTPITAADRRSS